MGIDGDNEVPTRPNKPGTMTESSSGAAAMRRKRHGRWERKCSVGVEVDWRTRLTMGEKKACRICRSVLAVQDSGRDGSTVSL